ncbi:MULTISPECIES: hypothetical protein [unclassified Azospirillum]|uniref:hypothetical protein n=1 Tax=unclassified Azospirillum TaxID=2630922 RepID=UPI000B6F467F|nr:MULTISPECIES: hypothetical protein [unclassified Azospirillum]SNT06832.1 hypothetical protein SAMN05880556_12173 [Azospirillum sp. RU38E]SNT21753.1 hypothetical protein SAMN05880591_12173 [Azospirillum sp. RU37A]
MHVLARRNDPTRQKLSAILLLLATLALMLACALAAGHARPNQGGQGFSAHKLLAGNASATPDDGAIKAEMTAKTLGTADRA